MSIAERVRVMYLSLMTSCLHLRIIKAEVGRLCMITDSLWTPCVARVPPRGPVCIEQRSHHVKPSANYDKPMDQVY